MFYNQRRQSWNMITTPFLMHVLYANILFRYILHDSIFIRDNQFTWNCKNKDRIFIFIFIMQYITLNISWFIDCDVLLESLQSVSPWGSRINPRSWGCRSCCIEYCRISCCHICFHNADDDDFQYDVSYFYYSCSCHFWWSGNHGYISSEQRHFRIGSHRQKPIEASRLKWRLGRWPFWSLKIVNKCWTILIWFLY